MNYRDEILMTLLAETDYIFNPVGAGHEKHQHIHEARHFYENAGGVPFRPPKGTDAEKKARQRAFEGLCSEGLVESRTGKTKTTYSRLTDKGDQMARDMILWTYDVNNMVDFLKILQANTGNEPPKFPRYVPECISELADLGERWEDCNTMKEKDWSSRVNDTIDKFLIGAVRGYCKSKTDCQCKRYYYLTPSGEKVLSGEISIIRHKFKKWKFSDMKDFSDCYVEQNARIRESIMSRPLIMRNEIWDIGLPVGAYYHKDRENY